LEKSLEANLVQKKSLWAFFKLIRLDYSLFGALGVFLSGFLAGDLQGFQLEYFIAFIIVLFSAVGSFAFNDYYDLKADKDNERFDRPLVLGLLSKELALITGSLSFLLAGFFSLFLNLVAASLVLISLPIFFLYNLRLKKVLFVKNVLIAYAFVATILLGSLVSNTVLESLTIFFALMGFIVGIAYEIMLDIGDVKGDKVHGISTISTRFGLQTSAWISVVLYVSIMILDPLPFFLMVDSRLYGDCIFLLLILIPVISYLLTSKSLIQDQSSNTIFRLKRRVFLTMQIGCIAYLVGVLL